MNKKKQFVLNVLFFFNSYYYFFVLYIQVLFIITNFMFNTYIYCHNVILCIM